jgi:hypothetical protein
MEFGDRPADGRDGNAGQLVKAGHAAGPSIEAAGPSIEVATDNLIHNAHLVDRALASILLGHPSEYVPIE